MTVESVGSDGVGILTKDEIDARKEAFSPLAQHSRLSVVPVDDSKSIVHIYGLKLAKFLDNGEIDPTVQPVWYCLLDPCHARRKTYKLGLKSTSNVTQHLERFHNLISEKTKKMKERKYLMANRKAKGIIMSTTNPERYYCLAAALHVALNAVPLRQLCGPDFQRIVVNIKDFPKLNEKKLKRSLIEIYEYLLNETRKELLKAKESFQVPCMHLNADLYTSKMLQTKFFGVRVAFTDVKTLSMKAINLGVKEVNPDSEERDLFIHNSDLLSVYLKEILDEYGLSLNDIVSATTDNGSDIKRLMEKTIERPREWCIAHLLNCVLVDSFGVSQHERNCKNVQARKVTASLRRIVEHVNKSDKARKKLKELQIKEGGKEERLANFIHQRWASAYLVYKKFLRNFHLLQEYINTSAVSCTWPSLLTLKIVQEFYSILKLIWDVIRESQNERSLASISVSKLQLIYLDLSVRAPIPIFDTNAEESRVELRNFSELHELTQGVLNRLKNALDIRFFNRYHPTKAFKKGRISTKGECAFSYLFDLCHLLTPSLRHGYVLRGLVAEVLKTSGDDLDTRKVEKHFKKIMDEAFSILITTVVRVEGYIDQKLLYADSMETSRKNQSKRTNAPTTALDELSNIFNSKGERIRSSRLSTRSTTDQIVNETIETKSIQEEIKDQIVVYRRQNKELDNITPKKDVLGFWRVESKGNRFPLLARMALSILSVKASAAGIERDFSPASDIMTRKRAKLKPWMAQVLVGIKLKQGLLPEDLMEIKEMDDFSVDIFKSRLVKGNNVSEIEDIVNSFDIIESVGDEDECDSLQSVSPAGSPSSLSLSPLCSPTTSQFNATVDLPIEDVSETLIGKRKVRSISFTRFSNSNSTTNSPSKKEMPLRRRTPIRKASKVKNYKN